MENWFWKSPLVCESRLVDGELPLSGVTPDSPDETLLRSAKYLNMNVGANALHYLFSSAVQAKILRKVHLSCLLSKGSPTPDMPCSSEVKGWRLLWSACVRDPSLLALVVSSGKIPQKSYLKDLGNSDQSLKRPKLHLLTKKRKKNKITPYKHSLGH